MYKTHKTKNVFEDKRKKKARKAIYDSCTLSIDILRIQEKP
jgi:hypothetical protein